MSILFSFLRNFDDNLPIAHYINIYIDHGQQVNTAPHVTLTD